MNNPNPQVYFIGAGPGAPDLITLRAQEVLKRADVIIYDYLVGTAILNAHAHTDAEWICVHDIVPRQEDWAELKQKKINELLIHHALMGRLVARLKSGDPFIFSRASEEMTVLKNAGVTFEVIPGITAAQAAACEAGIPLTSRASASSVAYVTGHAARKHLGPEVDWENIARMDTLVLYMGVSQIRHNCTKLIEAGKSPETPVIVASNVSKPEHLSVRGIIANIADRVEEVGINSPAIIIIGETVAEHSDFNWMQKSV